ncbi:MAG: branched chain amino acid ABC transporter substrate-binding protein [Desulfovibrio sp.]|nr:branched chain amino acid ABC transporter substrate-binding protein [Desulfovibrio sp.]|tara:strand:+ start:10314 stop:11441 length:1128 start_codon:yes stop_codon:yes gene_type:complete
MKRILFMACIMVLAATTAFAGTLKLGSMGPLTGPYAADGNDIANGVRVAIEVMKAEGGVPGFDDITLTPGDTVCDPRQAVASANKLINEEVLAVIGAYCSSSTIPSSETLAEEDIFMLTPASTHPDVTSRGLKNMFRTCGRDDHQAPAAVRFMTEVQGYKSIYIVDDKTTYSQGIADGVAAAAKEAGMNVLGHDHINQGDKDFSAILTKVKTANPDIFYISLQNSSTGALMVIQAKRLGIDAALMGQDAVYHPQIIDIAKGAVEGMFCTFGDIDKSAPAFISFMEKYQEMFNTGPGAYSAYAFDSAMAYMRAVKAAGTTDFDAVREALLKTEFVGASKLLKYEENGDSGSNYTVYIIKDGKFQPYWNSLTNKKFM